MRVLIAGATGAIGWHLAHILHQNGDDIFAISRSEGPKDLIDKRVQFIKGDIFDSHEIGQIVKEIAPDAIVNMLTSLPKDYTPEAMKKAAEFDTHLRVKGGENLHLAAVKYGVSRFIIQSACFWYAPGEGAAVEEDSLAFNASPGIAAGCETYNLLEKRLLNEKRLQGSVMRFGFFYGPRTWYEEGKSMAEQVRLGNYPVVGKGLGVWNFVHIEDAAMAIYQALLGEPGVYNINDDNPITLHKWVNAYANFLRGKAPLHISEQDCLSTRGEDALYYATKLRAASNEKAKKKLGFTPRPLEWLR